MFLRILEWSAHGEVVIPESGGDEQRRIVKSLFFVAEYLRDDPEALDAADGMLNEDTDTWFLLVLFFLCLGQVMGTRLFCRDWNTMIGKLSIKSFESKVNMGFYIRGNESWRGSGSENGNVRFFSLHGLGEESDTFLLGTDDDVLAGVALLLPCE